MVMQHLVPSKCLVAAIDVQERLAAAMPQERMAVVTRKINLLLAAAELLGASVLATEQYPKGLGPTIEPIGRKLHEIGVPRIEKTVFSAVAVPEFAQRLDEVGAGGRHRRRHGSACLRVPNGARSRRPRSRGARPDRRCHLAARRRPDHRDLPL